MSSNLGCFSFVLLCFLFGTEILNHSLNQSVSIPKPVVTWSLALSCLSSSSLVFFFFLPKSLSSSLKNALLCSNEPVFYLDSKSKCAPFSVIILSTKRSFNDDNPMLCIFIANVAIHLNDQVWDLHDHTCLLTVRPKAHKIRGDLAGRYWGREVY